MNDMIDPPRLVDGDGRAGFLRDAVRAAVDDRPPAEVAARLDDCLDGLFAGAGGGGPAGANGPASRRLLGVAGKVLAGVVLSLVGIGTAWMFVSEAPRSSETRVTSPVPPVVGETSNGDAESSAPLESASRERAGDLSPPSPEHRLPGPPEARRRVAPVEASKAPALDDGPLAPAPSPKPPAAAQSIEADLGLVQSAQDALRDGRLAAALEFTGRHGERYPDSALSEEREVLALTVLLRLGRREEAHVRYAAFARRFPDSPHRERFGEMFGH